MRRGFSIAGAGPLRTIEMGRKSHFIGDTECEVLERVWNLDSPTVHDVVGSLDRPLAYTTVMTTLNRLVEKGVLKRLMRGNRFVYRAAFSKPELQVKLAISLAHRLSSDPIFSAFEILLVLVEEIPPQDVDQLNRLEALIRRSDRRVADCDRRLERTGTPMFGG